MTKSSKGNRKPVKTHRKLFCPKGHEIAIVGRDKYGACNGCKREHKKKWDKENQEHVTEYNKRKWKNRTPEDILEKKIADHKSYEKHKEKRQEWQREYQEEHKEEIVARVKEWQKNNPELVREYQMKCATSRSGRIVAWTDWDKINEFERNKPKGMTTDHIIPLNNKKIWGLHVSWNLQYLPLRDNLVKLNKCVLLEASKWYGQILEKQGLK